MNSRLLLILLTLVALVGLLTAFGLYPPENKFSIFTTTISFLGSPDPGRNPHGYLWYQVGMSALVLLLSRFVWLRHANFRMHTGIALRVPSALYFVGMVLILISVWIPDSREIYWGKMRTGHLHTRIAIISIFTLLFAVIADAIVLVRCRFQKRSRWPIRIYSLLWIACIISLVSWEWKCRKNPDLEHWPGEGIHSTPLWEWILFAYLIGFLFWISRKRTAERGFPCL